MKTTFRFTLFQTLLFSLLVGTQLPVAAQLTTQAPAEIIGQKLPALDTDSSLPQKNVQVYLITKLGNPKLFDFFKQTQQFVAAELEEADYALNVLTLDSPEDLAKLALPEYPGTTITPDAEGKQIKQLVNPEKLSLPFLVIVDSDRNIVSSHTGFRPGREVEIVRVMRAVINKDAAALNLIKKQLTSPPPGQRVGKPAPTFTVTTWVQNPQPTVEKEKFQFVEFWATWCGPCVRLFPHAEENYLKYKDRVQFQHLTDEPADVVTPFLQAKETSFPVGIYDPESIIPSRSIPYAFLVNPDGIVVWEGHPGQFVDDEKAFQALLDAYVPTKEPAATAPTTP